MDKEIAGEAKPVIEIWREAYQRDPTLKGLNDEEKEKIREYLNSLSPQIRKALTEKGPDGRSILSRASLIAKKGVSLKKG